MYDKDDFEKPFDYIMYKLTGKTNNLKEKPVTGEVKDIPILSFTQSSSHNRYRVGCGRKYVCSCNKSEKEKVEEYFKTHYDGDLSKITDELRLRFNLNRRRTGKSSLKEARLNFSKNKNQRVIVTTYVNGKNEHICMCGSRQKTKVNKRFKELRKEGKELDEIKTILRGEFNKRKTAPKIIPTKPKPRIIIHSNGTVDIGKRTVKKGPGFYDYINMMIK